MEAVVYIQTPGWHFTGGLHLISFIHSCSLFWVRPSGVHVSGFDIIEQHWTIRCLFWFQLPDFGRRHSRSQIDGVLSHQAGCNQGNRVGHIVKLCRGQTGDQKDANMKWQSWSRWTLGPNPCAGAQMWGFGKDRGLPAHQRPNDKVSKLWVRHLRWCMPTMRGSHKVTVVLTKVE